MGEQNPHERYANFYTDFAFKKLFGSEANKECLLSFLNALLEDKEEIRDLTYLNVEHLGHAAAERKAVFDVLCENSKGEKFLIEMQKAEHDYFKDRAVLYKAFLIIKGKQEMDRSPEFMKFPKMERESRRYELPESVAIWLCDFDLPDRAKNDAENSEADIPYMDEWNLYSSNSIAAGKPVSIFPKNKYIIISLPNFKKTAKDVQGSLDAWLYLLNHASDGTELPNFGISAVEEALGRIRVDNADEELLTAQVKDMVTKEENATILASAILKGVAEGRAKGHAEGHARGLEEGAEAKNKELAKGFRDDGIPLEIISKRTGLSPEEIKAL